MYRAHQTSCLAFRRSTLQGIFPIPESMRIQADAYIEMTAVLISPVLAIAEDLAVYRIHGKNLCAADFQARDVEGAKRLVVSSGTVRQEVERWIRSHRRRIGSVNTRRFLDGLMFLPLEQEFRFASPRRFRYFMFLLRKNYAFGPTQGWLYTASKYVIALASLVIGYKRYKTLHAWCGKALNAFRPVAGERS
jgi:hypothetical protein